jgi:hypothetical protein
LYFALAFNLVYFVQEFFLAWANRAPPIGHLTMPLFTALFVLPWTLAVAAITSPPTPATGRIHRGIDWPLIVGSLVVLIIFRTVLASGLSV